MSHLVTLALDIIDFQKYFFKTIIKQAKKLTYKLGVDDSLQQVLSRSKK